MSIPLWILTGAYALHIVEASSLILLLTPQIAFQEFPLHPNYGVDCGGKR
jgi:hypothetical protein